MPQERDFYIHGKKKKFLAILTVFGFQATLITATESHYIDSYKSNSVYNNLLTLSSSFCLLSNPPLLNTALHLDQFGVTCSYTRMVTICSLSCVCSEMKNKTPQFPSSSKTSIFKALYGLFSLDSQFDMPSVNNTHMYMTGKHA